MSSVDSKPYNPFAFPQPLTTCEGGIYSADEKGPDCGGMTLRDYFAIRAPEPTDAEINFEAERDRLANPHGDSYKPARRSKLEIIAQRRYAYADAMLAERANGGAQ